MSANSSSATWPVPRPGRASTRALTAILAARALWNGAFAIHLLQQHEQSVAALILAFARFASVDALLSLLLAASWLAASPGRLLWLAPAIDAATRTALVGLVVIGPGGADVPLTALLYLWLLSTFAVVDGVLDVYEGLRLERTLGRRRGWISLAVSGAVAVATGLIMFVVYPGVSLLRTLLVILSVAHGAACALGTRHVSALRQERHALGEETPA